MCFSLYYFYFISILWSPDTLCIPLKFSMQCKLCAYDTQYGLSDISECERISLSEKKACHVQPIAAFLGSQICRYPDDKPL